MYDYRRFVFLAIYTVGYLVLSFDLIGAGHGTVFFLIPILTWPLVLIAVFVLPWIKARRSRWVFEITMTIHLMVSFILAFLYLASGDSGRLAMVMRVNNLYCIFTVLWYLTGQAVIWLSFLRFPQKEPYLP